VLFNIDAQKGTLTLVEHFSTGGKTPRHFGIDPSGKHLLIENQRTNQVMLCQIDEASGRLKPSGVMLDVPSPVCAVFMTLENQ
jgi:6-phosphogluconolactonase